MCDVQIFADLKHLIEETDLLISTTDLLP